MASPGAAPIAPTGAGAGAGAKLKMPARKTNCAGIVVYRLRNNSPEFLLLSSSKSGKWGFPKGHVEGTETKWEAAKRETMEEAGLDADSDLDILPNFTTSIRYNVHSSKRGPEDKTVTFWLGKVKGVAHEGKVKISKEHRDFCWANLDSAKDKINFPTLRSVLVECHERIAKANK